MNPLLQLQEDVAALLMANPATAAVPFSIYRRELIKAVQDEAAAAWKVRVPATDGSPAQVGLAALVLMPGLRVVTPNVPGPQYEVSIVVRVFHDPRVNNTGLSAEEVAMRSLAWLDGKILGGTTQLHGDEHNPALKPNYNYKGTLVFDCTLVGPMPQPIPGATMDPTISGGQQITLACVDPAAAIYFTIDGTAPIPPANTTDPTGTVQVYSGPFTMPASGITLRALAWDPAKLPSKIIDAVVTF